FRLREEEIRYILDDCAARTLIVQDDLLDSVETIVSDRAVFAGSLIHFGGRSAPARVLSYEILVPGAGGGGPTVAVATEDTWALIYTSGTTGKPKGAMRSHGSHALLNFATLLDMGFGLNDRCLLVMPMCHANSLNFASTFAYAGATCCVYDRKA